MKSILQENCECFLCLTTKNLQLHHCINGLHNRGMCDTYGLTVYLCAKHHDMVHRDQKLDESLKRHTQKAFEELYGHDEWMETFHKNYLE